MVDMFDDAQAINEQFQADALAAHLRRTAAGAGRASLSHCEDCGRPIPEERRLAAGGCTRCVACQAAMERGRR